MPKPANVTFEEAAAVPRRGADGAAGPSRQGRDPAGAEGPGQRRVGRRRHVRGAGRQGARSGGDRRVQHRGTSSIARSLGADHVVDYTAEDFTRSDRRYDLLLRRRGQQVVVASSSACSTRTGPSSSSAGRWPNRWLGPLGHVVRLDLAHAARSRKAAFFIAQVQQGGPGGPARAARGREADAGDRQAVRAERDRRRVPVHGRRARPGEGRGHTVKAVVCDRYGPPEVLRLEEVERPVPEDDEVLVRIRATTVNRSDCGLGAPRTSQPRLLRPRRPKRRILGLSSPATSRRPARTSPSSRSATRVFGVSGRARTRSTRVSGERSDCAAPAGSTFEEAAAARRSQPRTRMPAKGSHGRGGASSSTALPDRSVPQRCSSPSTSKRTSPPSATRRTSSSCARSAPTTSIDYTRKTSRRTARRYDVVFDAVGKHSFRRSQRLVEAGRRRLETDLGFMWHVPPLALC